MSFKFISMIIGIFDVLLIIMGIKIANKIHDEKNIFIKSSVNLLNRKKLILSCICMILGYIFIKLIIISNLGLFLNISPTKGIFNPYIQNRNYINILLVAIQIIIIGPIIEELYFRKILLGKLLKLSNNKVKSILFSAIIFGIVHFNLIQGIVAFLGGIVLGIIYYYTKSIKLTILVHILNNFLIIIPSPIGLWMNLIYLILGIFLIKIGYNKLKIYSEI